MRLYDRLFTKEDPEEGEDADFTAFINPESFTVVNTCKLEPTLAKARTGDRFQFERLGYFAVDTDSVPGSLVFNRTVTLRDTWARIEKAKKRS